MTSWMELEKLWRTSIKHTRSVVIPIYYKSFVKYLSDFMRKWLFILPINSVSVGISGHLARPYVYSGHIWPFGKAICLQWAYLAIWQGHMSTVGISGHLARPYVYSGHIWPFGKAICLQWAYLAIW